ncbi:amino acid adenylation domain-containing protein [Paraburkholderia sp. D15]|uniref:non-ribosomal peptide synthetase n=1 Tax=Paraburkholderia sp. D15 TaxID=2880218 RepID=UPI00247A7FAE|nr:non-ribosomal peptide synthetase [Paraburkholderia sp. D15]WGS52183.1 amino acid adenylation domain-containing protein [Paraburkholderia sp. D15]
MEQFDKHALARRIAALAPDARGRLLGALAEKGIDFAMLPIVPAKTLHAERPLSFQQQRMWFVSRLGGAESAFHISGLLRMDGALDRAALQRSLDLLIARHDTLRSRYAEDTAGVPWQTVVPQVAAPLAFSDLRELPHAQREAHAQALAREDANRPFDLAVPPLLRARLIVLDDDCHWLALTMHHIVSDGWSGEVMLRELCTAYAALTGNHAMGASAETSALTATQTATQSLPPLPITYADYTLWQRDLAGTGVFERQLGYWRTQLGANDASSANGANDANRAGPARLPLTTDRPRGAVQSFVGARLRFTLPAALSAQLRALALAHDTTLFNVLLTVLHAVLARLSGETDIRVGVPSANRARAELAPLVGFFVNTLVIRSTPLPDRPFDALLAATHQAMLDAHANQDVPFEQIVEALQPDRSLSANPLFQVKFTQQLPLVAHTLPGGLTMTPLALDDDATRFDVGLDVTDLPDGIEGVVSYASDLFDRATIQRLADAFAGIAAQIAAAPRTPVGKLTLPGARDGATGASRAWAHGDVLSVWRAQVAAQPDAPALNTDAGGEVSRAGLDAATDRIAQRLIALGASADRRVALCAPRSAAFAMGLLGIMKSGAAYVPLDPAAPPARLAEMLADSGALCALGFGAGVDALRAAGCEPLVLTGIATKPLLDARAAGEGASGNGVAGRDASENIATDRTAQRDAASSEAAFTAPSIHPHQAAYLIYTSGSTGKPKGVVVSHGALADYTQGVIERFGWDSTLRMAMVSTVAADLGHTVLFGALCSGSALYLPDADCAFDPGRFADYIARHRIDVLKIVPSHLGALLQAECAADALPAQALVLGGEPLPASLVERVRSLKPACRIFNHYGPTETTVGVLATQVGEGGLGAEVPIGRPLPNAYAQILDARLEPVPAGVEGELYLGGPGVARGYLGRPDLTAERFVPDPRGTGERLYRSGDRARWTADGSVVFIGRADDQVKIRGYRVEPREIAHVLREHPDVAQAEVIAATRDDGAYQLLAYVVGETTRQAEPAALRAHLAAQLPDYMVPAQVIVIERMPLTPNGKLDRRALPAPQAVAQAAPGDEAPQGDTERTLAEIWQQVLRLPSVGRHANFFDLGGDSILSLQIIGRARRAGLKLTPRQVFEQQTIAALAQVAVPFVASASAAAGNAKPKTKAAVTAVALTPAQSRFFALDLPNPAHWNQSVLLHCPTPLDPAALDAAFAALIARHDALRSRFVRDARGQWQTQSLPHAQVVASCIAHGAAVDADDLTRQCEAAQRSLDPANGVLLRALHVNVRHAAADHDGDCNERLFIAIHHLAVDGVSWRILIDELEQSYRAALSGRPADLPEPGIGAQAWAADWQRRLASGALAASADAWLAAGEGVAPWPLDSLGAARQAAGHRNNREDHAEHTGAPRIAAVRVALDAPATQALLALPGIDRRLHIDDLLLTAFAQALARVAGTQDAAVWTEVEGHGRDELPAWRDAPDATRSVGWFTSLYPLALNADTNLATALNRNRQRRHTLPDDGVSFGLLRELGDPATQARLRTLPLPTLRFNYLGRVDAGVDTSGLFALSDEPRGSERDPLAPPPAALALDARVQGGRLHADWTFDTARCAQPQVETVAAAFLAALHELIALCTQDGFATLAPVDFPAAPVDVAQVAGLPASPARIEDLYPLSPMQRGMLFEVQYASDEARYLNQFALTLDALDVARFEAAWHATLQRHPVLRTAIASASGVVDADGAEIPLQWVDRVARMPIERHDLSASADPAADLARFAKVHRETPFDLARAPLMRTTLVRLPDQRHRFLWTRHHLLLDGWSSARVLAEVVARYRDPDAAMWSAPMPRYRDYIGWLTAHRASFDEAGRDFWRARVNAPSEPTLLAAALPAPAKADVKQTANATDKAADITHHDFVDIGWTQAQTDALAASARAQRITLNTLLQGAWLVLLQRYTGQTTVAFGATVAGRPDSLPGAQEMVGLFINTLPIVREVEPAAQRDVWLRALQDENLALREHEHMPLAEIQRLRSGGGALFDTLLVFENYPLDTSMHEHAGDPRALRYSEVATVETTGYAMSAVATVEPELSVRLGFDTTRFERAAVERLAVHLREVTAQLADPSIVALGEITLLDAAQRAVFERDSVGPRLTVPDEPVHRLISRRAQSAPAAIAVSCAGVELDYAALEQRSDRLARRLRALGIGSEDRVAIAMQRSADMPVAILAVWKAGAAYVPLDPEYPLDRIAYVLEDAGVRAAIADDVGRARLPASPAVVIVSPEEGDEAADGQAQHLTGLALDHPPVALCQAAYAIYTSGSTGRPKGVVITHETLANFMQAMQRMPGLAATDRLLAVASLSFDIAVLDLVLPLVVGARVHLARHDEARDPAWLMRALADATLMQATPATWRMLVEAGWRPSPGMRMFSGGEALPADLATALALPGAELWNLYGPTETTIYASGTRIDTVDPVNQSIGRPIANTTLYVLDAALQPAPVGVAGELYIGGAGLARGYHQRGALSAERFVPDPFASATTPGARMYRSGDLVRWRPDGGVEYLSRIDHQVKVRGFRIELGEIEAVLAAEPGVRRAVVIAREGAGGPRLLGYVCANTGASLDVMSLRAALASRLPAYMQPSHIAILDEMPLTPNGKLDRRALPDPADDANRADAASEPRTAFEDDIAEIWQALLGVTAIAPSDDFFALGGHSLLATRLVARISASYGVQLPLRTVFEAPTLRAFSANVERLRGASTTAASLDRLDALLDELSLD